MRIRWGKLMGEMDLRMLGEFMSTPNSLTFHSAMQVKALITSSICPNIFSVSFMFHSAISYLLI
jgi:hypothetical protein